MATTFTMSDFGTTFATRERGEVLREQVLERIQDGAVILDFAGVRHVSYSFVDEFVGKLYAEHGASIRMDNVAGSIARVAERAIARRADCCPR